jgi:hypothetical protein
MMDQSWVDLLHLVSDMDAARIAGVEPALIEPVRGNEATGWLQGFLEHLAGRRSFEGLIGRALSDGDRVGSLRLAAKATQAGVTLSAALGVKLDEFYHQLRKEHGERVTKALAALDTLEPEALDVATMAEEYRADLKRLALAETRPGNQEESERVEAAQQGLARLQDEVQQLLDLAREEAKGRRMDLFKTARRAVERVLSVLEQTPVQEGPEVDLLRILPGLILSRRRELLEAIATKERPVEDAALQAELAAFAAVTGPTHRSPPRPMTSPRPVAVRIPSQLSVVSELVFRPVRPALRGLSGAEELQRLMARTERVRTDKESSLLWLSLAKVTENELIRLAALGYGLLYEGRSLLAQNQYRFATELLRDTLQCLFDARQYVEDDALEQAAFALVATRAWPRRMASQSSREPELQALTWLDRPQQMFSWLRDNGHALLIANIAADIQRPDVAECFLGVARSHFGSERELLRAYVDAILKPQRLLAEPNLTMEKLARLLNPAGPSPTLLNALDEAAQLLETMGKRPPSPALRAAVLKQAEILREELNGMSRSLALPIDEVFELLPSLLTSRVDGGEQRNTPHLTIQPLIKAFRPSERSEELLLPVLVKNIGAIASEDLSLQLSIVQDADAELGISFHGTSRQLEQPVGGLDPDMTQQVNFLLNLDERLAERRTECRFRAILVSRRERLLDETFTVGIRPDDYSLRRSPYTTGEVVTGEHFIGREKERKQVRDALVGGTQERTPLVVGIRRIGKTSLLRQMIEDPEVLRHYYPIYVDVEDRPQSETTSTFFVYLCEKIFEGIPQENRHGVVFHRKDFETEPYSAFERFTQSLSALQMKKRLLLVIDELDWLFRLAAKTLERQARQSTPLRSNEAFQPEVFGAIRKALLHCKALRMVFAGLPVLLQQSSYDTRLFGLLDLVRVDRFSDEEALKILNAASNSFTFPPVTREVLFRSTGLQPYLLQVVCHHLFARMVDSGRDVVTPMDVTEVVETELLANETYFTDYIALIGKSTFLLHALALAQREVAPRREFVTAKDVAQQLALLGEEHTAEAVQAQLRELCQNDRPLVRQAPNNLNRFQLVIGLLGDWLIQRTSR